MPTNDAAWILKESAKLPPTSRQEIERKRKDEDILAVYRKEADDFLLSWGYKPWTRPDGRNRPLRTKHNVIIFRAIERECSVVKLRVEYGMSFRDIGKHLGISHVAAWKRYNAAWKWMLASERHRDSWLELAWKKHNMAEQVNSHIQHLTKRTRNRILREQGLLPKRVRATKWQMQFRNPRK